MTDKKKVAPYGAWKSRITADLLVQKTVGLGEVLSDYHGVPPDQEQTSQESVSLLWHELRPSEQGRTALIQMSTPAAAPATGSTEALASADNTTDITAGKYNARSGVHEYGGGASTVLADGKILFTDFGSWAVYRVSPDSSSAAPAAPLAPTPPERVDPMHEGGTWRFADFAPHPTLPHMVACVREDHTIDTPAAVVNDLVLLDLEQKSLRVLATGADFYSSPAFSPSGTKLAFVEWSHPSMPFWDTDLVVVSFDLDRRATGSYRAQVQKEPCSPHGEVLQQPKWQPASPTSLLAGDGNPEKLYFTSDRTQFSNLYWVQVSQYSGQLELSRPQLGIEKVLEADVQQPAWLLGRSTYAFLNPDVLFVILTKGASDTFALFHLKHRTYLRLDTPFRGAHSIAAISQKQIAAVFASDDKPIELSMIDLTGALSAVNAGVDSYRLHTREVTTIKRTSDIVAQGEVPSPWFTRASEIAFPTELPDGTASEAYACLFPPHNPEYVAPEGSLPPCQIVIHGGPTSAWPAGLNLEVAYWTSRGWLVAALNYGGSTGFGRAYVDRLNGQWGVVDVEDCANLARFLGRTTSSTPALSAQERGQASVTTPTPGAQAQDELLNISHAPDGSVTATLERQGKRWGAKDILACLATGLIDVGLVASASLAPPLAAAAAGAVAGLYLLGKAATVEQESVQAIPGVGLQVSTVRGLRLPWNDVPGQFVRTSLRRHVISLAEIEDLVVQESIQTYSIATSVTVVPKDGQKLTTLFPSTRPRIPLVQRIYQALLDGLFPQDDKASSDVPKNKDVTRADPDRIVVSGGSSGGYTVLAALVAHPTAFKAGTSRYGISELSALFRDSHKFENCYPEVLLGGSPDTAPETYRKRSPLYGASKIRAPLLVLQGGMDRVVPPSQSEEIVRQIESQPDGHGRVRYVLFPEEGHGFRQAANKKRALQEEAEWYAAKLDIQHQL